MPKGKDPFWDHVDEVDGRWKCKYCEQSFSLKVSVSRIKFHLAGESARGVEVCKNAPTVVQRKALEAILSKRQKVMSPVPTNDQGQASVSQEMEVDTPTLEQLEILNRMTTDMLQQPQGPENPLLQVQEHVGDVLETPSVPVENDALNTSWENTAGQMQPDFTRMPSSSNNEAGSTFPIQAEDWERYFIDDPFLQSLTLEEQVPRAQVMPSSSNEEIRIADPTTMSSEFRLPKLKELTLQNLRKLKSIYSGLLICDSLEDVKIDGCHKLKRIPISLPLPSLQRLKVSPRDWWEQVEWGHPIAKSSLLPFCNFLESDVESDLESAREQEEDEEDEIEDHYKNLSEIAYPQSEAILKLSCIYHEEEESEVLPDDEEDEQLSDDHDQEDVDFI
ncbi:hypothetical protein Tsubulata_027854 [Turnera subulata]|uniref:BED-type domain-containing protein n=1 Tax=Turnera subulata TaxID=218843 RepID=A0A9Q0F3G1_9ROSI|nr:hypothetical protein Tsubulata_027854 [Turnera subulata]